MKAKDLITLLEAVDPEFEVILSVDKEGNSFCPANEVKEGYYERDSPYYVEVSENDLDWVAPNCVTLYPEE